MSFKQFIKPIKSKIILFIILFIIFPLPISTPTMGACPQPERISPDEIILVPMTCYGNDRWEIMPFGGIMFFSILIGLGSHFIEHATILPTLIFEILTIPYIIIIPYIVSCLIIFLYRKIKNKNLITDDTLRS